MASIAGKTQRTRRGTSRATVKMTDVARMAGVSSMTVSNTFKFPDKVVPETRQKVLDAAKALGYIPNLIAGELASGRSRVVAAITPSIRNSDFADMIMGLAAALNQDGYQLVLSVIARPARDHAAVRTLIGRRVDGIVLTGADRDATTRNLIKKSEMPVVETWDLDGPFIDMGVGFDNRQAALDANRLLVDRQRRKIGCMIFDTVQSGRLARRLEGYKEAMQEAGLQDDLIVRVPFDSGFAGGKLGLAQLMEREPALDGLFCVTDVLATGATFECMERKISIPEQVAIIGFGDYELSSAIPHGLSSIRTPGKLIGTTAARMILDRVDGATAGNHVENVGYTLIQRGSC